MDKEKLLRIYNMLNSSDKENMYMGFKILESYDIKTIEEEVIYVREKTSSQCINNS